jgi:hypothetical protein
MAGGAAEVLPVSLNCPLPLRRTHPPTLLCCFCVFAAMGVTSTKSERLEVNLSLFGKRGGKSHLGTILLSAVSEIWRFCMVIRLLLPISLRTMYGFKEPVFLIPLKIMRHAMLCLSVIVFLICVCWHPERMCRALSTCGQREQVRLVESLNNTACVWLYRVSVLYFRMKHLVLKGTSDDVRQALLVAPLAVPSFMRVW